jgi:hypothetical protein
MARRIYKGQSALRITLKTYTDLEGIQAAAVKYTKPDGTAGSFAAGVQDTGEGIIFHECVEGRLTGRDGGHSGLLSPSGTAGRRRGKRYGYLCGRKGNEKRGIKNDR